MLDECSTFEPLCDNMLLKGNGGDLILYQNLILRSSLIRDVEAVFPICLKIGAIS